MTMKMHKGLPTYKNDEESDNRQAETTDRAQATLNIINRLLREKGIAERTGVSSVLNQLELTPIPIGAVIPIANSILKASILDSDRIEKKVPLVYVWLDAYLAGQNGSKRKIFVMKDLAAEQLAGQTEPELGSGTEGE